MRPAVLGLMSGLNSLIFYPAVSGDDGWRNPLLSQFDNSGDFLRVGYRTAPTPGILRGFIRFPSINIEPGSTIVSCRLKLKAYANSIYTPTLHVNFVFHSNPPAPTDEGEVMALNVSLFTHHVDWQISDWVDGTQYSSLELSTILQEIIDKSTNASFDNAMTSLVLSNDNMTADSIVNTNYTARTHDSTTGKGYFEVYIDSKVSGQMDVGLADVRRTFLDEFVGGSSSSWGYRGAGRTFYNNVMSDPVPSYTTGDIIACAFDYPNGKVWWAKNDVYIDSGDPANGTNPRYSNLSSAFQVHPAVSLRRSIAGQTQRVTIRLKTADFTYSPPSGFDAFDDLVSPWTSGASVLVLVGAHGLAYNTVNASSIDYLGGAEKPELHVSWRP